MSHVYVVQGEHWNVPGRPMTAHDTKKGADAQALELVNLMLTDVDLEHETKWKRGLRRVRNELKRLHGYCDPYACDVWIERAEVQP